MSTNTVESFYAFRFKEMWKYLTGESFSFWMICGYLFFEYFRPQSIYPAIDVIPWAQMFLMLALIGAVIDPKCKLVTTKVTKWMIFYLILVLISAYFVAYYPDASQRNLVHYYQWVIAHLLILSIINTKERFYIFFMIFCLASFKLSLFGAQVWASRGFGFTSWGIRGPPGYFTNSGELSIQMLILFPIGYYLLNALKDNLKKWEKIILLLFTITAAMTILGASSRGSQLALIVQLMVIFHRKIFKVKYIILAVCCALLIYNYLPDEQKERFETMGEDKTSVQRLLYWQHGMDMIREHPVMGVGFFNFPRYYAHHYPEDMLYEHAELPHNIFIQAGTDTGLIGLLIFLVIVCYGLFAPIRLRRDMAGREVSPLAHNMAMALSLGMLGYVIAGQFVSVAYYPYLWIGVTLIACWENVVKSADSVTGVTKSASMS